MSFCFHVTLFLLLYSADKDHSSRRNGTRRINFKFKTNHYREDYYKAILAHCTNYFDGFLTEKPLDMMVSTFYLLVVYYQNILIRPSNTRCICIQKKVSLSSLWFKCLWLKKAKQEKKYSEKVTHIKSRTKVKTKML